MIITSVWVKFEGPEAEKNLHNYEEALDGQVFGPVPVPWQYHVERADRSPYPNSLNLRLTNHGGVIDEQILLDYLRSRFTPDISIGIYATLEDSRH